MKKIHVISSCEKSRNAVHKLLSSGHKTVAVACKQIVLSQPEALVLLTVGTPDGQVYVFDIKRCKDIMMDGELWRILQSPELSKVMHDCRNASAALKNQFNVTLRNVFDTQAAYCILMMLRCLPPRFIHQYYLYEKFGDPSQRLEDEIQASVSGGGIFWAQRPLSQDMLRSAATDVRLLLSATHDNLRRELSPAQDGLLEELCHAYISGDFKVKVTETTSTRRQKPILRLSDTQKYLLTDTVPQSACELSYSK